MTPRWRHVLFDLDGTLVNTVDLIVASFQHAHREVLGGELSRDTVTGWIGRTLPDIYADWPEHTQQLWDTYVEFNLANLERLQTSFDGITEMAEQLDAADVVCGVATSKGRHAASRSLAASGLAERVELISTLEDSQRHKPHPDPLLHAVDHWRAAGHRVDAGDAVYVGDAVVDVQAARAAGMAAIAVTWGAGSVPDLRAAAPDLLVESPAELAAVLLG